MEQVRHDHVADLFRTAFFEQPRRINVRQFCPAHHAAAEVVGESRAKNDAFYTEQAGKPNAS
jgi:hypothetical protein